MSDVSMREMLEAGVHFGHQTRLWHPGMAPYLFGQRHKIHIINLEHSLPMYREAMNFLGAKAAKRSRILFVGTKRPAQRIIREQAERCGMPYVNRRWLGGLLTNFKTVSSSVKRLNDLEAMRDNGGMARLSKKEALTLMRELGKLDASLAGIKNMGKLPDVLFVIDIGYENIAVTEARKLGIPVVGIVDSNNDPAKVDYVVPGNDDAIRAIQLYCHGAADAVLDAREAAAQLSEAEADEFVELDEEGNPIQPDEKPRRPAAAKKTSTGKKRTRDRDTRTADKAPKVTERAGTTPDSAQDQVSATTESTAETKKETTATAEPTTTDTGKETTATAEPTAETKKETTATAEAGVTTTDTQAKGIQSDVS